ncbi:MAG TPA: inorganic phosphate transporter, partial [Acidilobales archaeon]|nr:inorganic phosphate transporter [Acidilobales archaeon]
MGSITLLLIILGLALAFYIAWCIGSNDAANPTNTAVGSGALSITKAIVLFSIFAFLGALVQGWMVIKTFGRGISEIRLVHDAVIASLSTALWITIASYKGLPISTTHSSVGSVLGIGLAYTILGYGISVNLQVLIKIIISWITSPLGAIALAAIFYILFKMLALKLTKAGIDVDRIFRLILIFSLAYSAYSFGANDVGNATGV